MLPLQWTLPWQVRPAEVSSRIPTLREGVSSGLLSPAIPERLSEGLLADSELPRPLLDCQGVSGDQVGHFVEPRVMLDDLHPFRPADMRSLGLGPSHACLPPLRSASALLLGEPAEDEQQQLSRAAIDAVGPLFVDRMDLDPLAPDRRNSMEVWAPPSRVSRSKAQMSKILKRPALLSRIHALQVVPLLALPAGELRLPEPVAERYAQGERQWVTTLAHALKLGMQLEMHVDEREIDHFWWYVSRRRARRWFWPTTTHCQAARDISPASPSACRRWPVSPAAILTTAPASAPATAASCSSGTSATTGCWTSDWCCRRWRCWPRAAASTSTPAMSQRERFDSVVESVLYERLRASGITRPRDGRENVLRDPSSRGIVQMDLSWPERRLMVLLDGREFHVATANQVLTDEDKRNHAIAAGVAGTGVHGV